MKKKEKYFAIMGTQEDYPLKKYKDTFYNIID